MISLRLVRPVVEQPLGVGNTTLTAFPACEFMSHFVVASEKTTLFHQIVERVDEILRVAEQSQKPLEVDPSRGQLFELFVVAEAAGLVSDESPQDLTADGLCRALSERWGLKDAAEESFRQQTRLAGDQLTRMRSLWSIMRMWMEWTYAWRRWPEFHLPV